MNERMDSILDIHRAIWPGEVPLDLGSIKGTRAKNKAAP